MVQVVEVVESVVFGFMDVGMVLFLIWLFVNNFFQIDYVQDLYGGIYFDVGYVECFIGVGIGFKEVYLCNFMYFVYFDIVEEGVFDFDVGVKIFKGLNVFRDLLILVVVCFDYFGWVFGVWEWVIVDC